MGFIISLYQDFFFQPLFNALVFLTGLMPFYDLGLAVILLTVLVRIIIFPFTHRSIVTQIKMRAIEPEIKKIREKYKNSQQELAQKTMELYKEHGVSPFSGCLMLIVQFPVLIALYQVFLNSIYTSSHLLYSFVLLPETVHINFLGLINLSETNIVLAFLAGFSQFIQMRLAVPPGSEKEQSGGSGGMEDMSKKFMKQAQYIFPIVIILISLRFPAALALYWTTSNIFAILHEGVVRKKSFVLAAKEQ